MTITIIDSPRFFHGTVLIHKVQASIYFYTADIVKYNSIGCEKQPGTNNNIIAL